MDGDGNSADDSADTMTDATAIVATLDLATKIKMLSGRTFWETESVPSAGLERIVVSDGPHGLRCQVGASDHLGVSGARPATCFPPACLTGSTWDVDLVAEIGAAIGAEAVSQGVTVVLGPGLNIKRHPAGGRNFEYYSEDPFLGGKLAAAWARGVQSNGVGTSVKHFAVNNQEAYRLVVDVIIDERTLREVYLAGFETVVREADPWTVMCSYNRINGVYASDNRELLTTILREEWGFDGLVMSDWGATNDRVAGVAAGMDLEMPGSTGAFDAGVSAAVADGSLAEADVDRCAARVVDLIARGQRSAGERPAFDADAHHALARRAAAAGTILLTNNGALPLEARGRIAVIGSFATDPRYQAAGSSQVTPTRLDAALDAIRTRVGDEAEVVFAEGYDPRTGVSTERQFNEAIEAARTADVVVCFAGLPAAAESEGFDRDTLDLPNDHVRLIEVLASQDAPLVVVLNHGGVVHLPWVDRVDAVVDAYLGGQAGGSGVVDVLFGDADPGGRLAESVPHNVWQLPADVNFPGSPKQVQYREGMYVGYRFHDTAGVPSQFPFGFGLSYTSFEWTDVAVDGDGFDRTVSVTVTNTGDRRGSDVVQVYVRDVESTADRPHQELKGFAKVTLDPGASETVRIALDRRSFAVWDVAAHDWLVEAGAFDIVVARSSADPVDVVSIDVASEDRLGPDERPSGRVANDAEFAAMLGHAVPAPDSVRPFTLNSTLEDLEETRLGAMVSGAVIKEAIKRVAHEFPDPDEATIRMVKTAVREGPIRGLALMSGGAFGFDQIEVILDAANGDWKSAGRGAATQVAAAIRKR